MLHCAQDGFVGRFAKESDVFNVRGSHIRPLKEGVEVWETSRDMEVNSLKASVQRGDSEPVGLMKSQGSR